MAAAEVIDVDDDVRVAPEGLGRKISDVIAEKEAAKKPYFAFEYYPPRTEDGVKNLLNRFDKMVQQGNLFKPIWKCVVSQQPDA